VIKLNSTLHELTIVFPVIDLHRCWSLADNQCAAQCTDSCSHKSQTAIHKPRFETPALFLHSPRRGEAEVMTSVYAPSAFQPPYPTSSVKRAWRHPRPISASRINAAFSLVAASLHFASLCLSDVQHRRRYTVIAHPFYLSINSHPAANDIYRVVPKSNNKKKIYTSSS